MADDALAPIRAGERIQVLDVIRGFALLGIFLMNVEWFNRPIADLDQGLPTGLHGLDLLAAWGVHLLVRGKFWTMFSLLFGMGFAVMLGRAERAGRDFIVPYLRRIGALAVFGVAHFVLLWGGDILFSYAVGAALLLVVFFGQPGWILAGIVACLIAAILGIQALGQAAFGLAVAALMALYVRDEAEIPTARGILPMVSLAMWSIGLVLVTLALFNRSVALGLVAALVLASGEVSRRFRQPPELRTLRAGAHLYLAAFLGMALIGFAWTVAPSMKPTPSPQQIEEIAKHRAEQTETARTEAQVMSGRSYVAAVRFRLGEFPRNAGNDLGFAGLVVGMFLIGVWFIRSGVIERAREHARLFRRLAFVALPIGLVLTMLSAAIAVSHEEGVNDAPYQLSQGLLLIGNLPACLGYVGAIVLLFDSPRAGRWLAVLAPAGRMALTNYLGQSLLQGMFFYGYGLGHWGMPRAQQVLFVGLVYALQVMFSHWWLARFQYGPMEWLWRAATYWRWPAFRRVTAESL